jgi:hypothetical protein
VADPFAPWADASCDLRLPYGLTEHRRWILSRDFNGAASAPVVERLPITVVRQWQLRTAECPRDLQKAWILNPATQQRSVPNGGYPHSIVDSGARFGTDYPRRESSLRYRVSRKSCGRLTTRHMVIQLQSPTYRHQERDCPS